MSLTSPDFESGAYTNFATPAAINWGTDNKASGFRIATVVSFGHCGLPFRFFASPSRTRLDSG